GVDRVADVVAAPFRRCGRRCHHGRPGVMQHRVDTLRLAVRSPAGREVPARRLAERFTRDVLEQFSQIVEAHSPGRVVLIRRMALRWSLSEAEMAEPAEAVSRAADLADAIAARGGGLPHATDTVATF